jgi:hypothetical protein
VVTKSFVSQESRLVLAKVKLSRKKGIGSSLELWVIRARVHHMEGQSQILGWACLQPFQTFSYVPGVVVRAWDPSTWEMEAEGSGVWGQPGFHSEFWASLSYIAKACLKKQYQTKMFTSEYLWDLINSGLPTPLKCSKPMFLPFDIFFLQD